MKELVNKNLITLKCVLFCFFSGVGCIFPFLPVHMLHVGLERGEARLISAVAPCVAILGPAILGCLIDKLSVGRGTTGGNPGPSGSGKLLRIVIAICMILSAFFYTLLLAVPYTDRQVARRPQVLFMCDAESTYIMQEICKEDMRCNTWSGVKTGVLAVGMCEYGCADDNMTWVKQPFVTTSTTTTLSPMYNTVINYTTPLNMSSYDEDEDDFEVHPPHLCYKGQCLVYMQHAARMRIPMSLEASQLLDTNTTEDSQWCTYRASSPSCAVPAEKLPEWSVLASECRPAVRCAVLDPYDEPGGVLADADCRAPAAAPAATFALYLTIRMFADIWPAAALALLGAACVIATRETSLGRGDVGRQLAFGALGLAIFPPLAGLAAEAFESQFVFPFIMHAVFMLIGAIILICDKHMPLSTPEWWWHTSTGVLAMPMNTVRRYGAETAALGAVLALLGTLWAGIDAYLPWTVMELDGSLWRVGMTLTAGALPGVLALYWAEALVDYIGHSNIFISAFTFYCLRYTGLAYSTDYSWIIVCEVLEVFTLSLVWVTAVLYFRHLVPRRHTAAGQAIPVIAHFCIGRCIGAIISGMVKLSQPLESQRAVYRALGVASLVAAAVYLALYHLVLAPRCAARPAPPPPALLSGLNANGSNGNYSPMRVYHEERSRKGQFRY